MKNDAGARGAYPRWNNLHEVMRNEIGDKGPSLVVQAVANLLPQFYFNRLRTGLWRSLKFRIGQGSMVMGELFFSGDGDWSELFSIGDHTYISGPLRVNLGGSVHIGSGINVGHDCLFVTVDHDIGGPERRAGFSSNRSIVIEDGAWIASRVVILPGVTIGRGAIVAAGAVVTRDVPANTMVGGVPAKTLRSLTR